MWPTSIAIWKRSAPAAVRAGVALARLADVGEARPRSRGPCSTPRRCQPVRLAPATNWPSRSASSATISPAKPDRAERARIGAERLAGSRPRSPGGSRCPSAALELRLVEPVVAADEREHDACRPAFDDRHRLRRRRRVDAEQLGERLDRRRPRASRPPAGASSRSGNSGARGIAARDLEVGGVVAVLAGDERVLARARRREEVDRLAAAHHPRLGLRRRRTRARSARRSARRRPRGAGSSARGPPRRGRTSRSPS